MRRLVLLLVTGLALAGCGGSSSHTSTTTDTAAAQAQIKSAYVKFFSDKTDVAGKVRLLQNGPKFRPVVFAFANNPLAARVSATVSSVRLQGPNKAKVVYQVKFASSSLPEQTGTAVRENGTWKVGDETICKLIALQGSTPAVCKKP